MRFSVEAYKVTEGRYSRRFPWRSRLVDSETGETEFEIPKACKSRWHAERYAQRYVRRHERNGSFETPIGIVAQADE